MPSLSKFVLVAAAASTVSVSYVSAGKFSKKSSSRSSTSTALAAFTGLAGAFAKTENPYANRADPLSNEELPQVHAAMVEALGTALSDVDQMDSLYAQFQTEYKGESAIMDADDDFKGEKRAIFQKNVEQAHKMNLAQLAEEGANKVKTVYGVTKFMDLTYDEFLAGSTGLKGAMPKTLKKWTATTDETLFKPVCKEVAETKKFLNGESKTFRKECSTPAPIRTGDGESRDWRDEGAITAVKDQGQCGSCWAFSTVETIESATRIQGLSDTFIGAPQELVSCDTAGDDMGCKGGLPINGYEFLEGKALESESDYPYTSGVSKRSGTCKADYYEGKFEVVSYGQADSEEDMRDYVLNKGPLSIGVHANSAWQFYFGGVLKASDCDGQPNHAVQAVALNQDDSENPYWVVRNSWASGWGEEGYIRLAYGTDTCKITDMATYAEVDAAGQKEAGVTKAVKTYTV